MIQVRKSEDRGHAQHGWLDSRHTFSFASYQDPRHMGVSALRVINQDVVKAGSGFGAHSHDNMEILSYVLRGALSHRDSMGNEEKIPAGEFQLMSAGTGVTHSEYNKEDSDAEFLQIWLFPNVRNAEPRYQQKAFSDVNGLQLVVSPTGENGSLEIRQDARIYRGSLSAGAEARHELIGKNAWVQVIRGEIRVNDVILQAGDGAQLSAETAAEIVAHSDTEFLFFDLP